MLYKYLPSNYSNICDQYIVNVRFVLFVIIMPDFNLDVVQYSGWKHKSKLFDLRGLFVSICFSKINCTHQKILCKIL